MSQRLVTQLVLGYINYESMRISKSKDTRTEAMIFLGTVYINYEKDFAKAEPLFKEIFDKYPDNTIAGMSLGECYWKTGKYYLAMSVYKSMLDKIRYDKRYEAFYNIYGYKLLDKGFNDDAIEVFKKQVEFFPNKANSYDSLGDGYRKIGKIKLAVEQYEKALRIDPNFEASKEKLKELKGYK